MPRRHVVIAVGIILIATAASWLFSRATSPPPVALPTSATRPDDDLLDRVGTIAIDGKRVDEALEILRREFGIAAVDLRDKDSSRYPTDRIDCPLKRGSLRAALEVVVYGRSLTYTLDGDTLQVRTWGDEEPSPMRLHVYPLPPPSPGSRALGGEILERLISNEIAPYDWESSFEAFVVPGGIALIAPDRVHRKVGWMLQRFHQAHASPVAMDPIVVTGRFHNTPETERIRAVLQQPFDIPEDVSLGTTMTLAELCQLLQDKYELPTLVNTKALVDIGIDRDEVKVTLVRPPGISVPPPTLKTVLQRALEKHELACYVGDDLLCITTPGWAEEAVYTVAYPVADLISCGLDLPSIQGLTADALSKESWEVIGGPDGLELTEHLLLVDDNDAVHEQVAELLGNLRQLLDPRNDHLSQRNTPAMPILFRGREGIAASKRRMETRIFDVRHLVDPDFGLMAPQTLVELIKSTDRATFKNDGVANVYRGLLLVRQRPTPMAQVERLIGFLSDEMQSLPRPIDAAGSSDEELYEDLFQRLEADVGEPRRFYAAQLLLSMQRKPEPKRLLDVWARSREPLVDAALAEPLNELWAQVAASPLRTGQLVDTLQLAQQSAKRAKIIRWLGFSGPSAMVPLMTLLHGTNRTDQIAAAAALLNFVGETQGAQPRLIELLKETGERCFFDAYMMTGGDTQKAIPVLRRMVLADEFSHPRLGNRIQLVRATAVEALRSLKTDAQVAIPDLLIAVHRDQAEGNGLSQSIRYGLEHDIDPTGEATRRVLDEWSASEDPSVRQQVVRIKIGLTEDGNPFGSHNPYWPDGLTDDGNPNPFRSKE